jgi:phenylalanyl-tRNA synthetase beta chain
VQPENIAGIVMGSRYPEQWGEEKGARFDFFALKGDVETLTGGLPVRFEAAQHAALHPGRSAAIMIGNEIAGYIGELHPRLQQKYELPAAPVAFELAVSALSGVTAPWYKAISRMPAVRRDIALLVDDKVPVQAMADAINAEKLASVIDFSAFDLYRGASLDPGKKSVAFRIVMQDTDRTLTDSETDAVVAGIINVLGKKYGATLRK